MSVLTDMQCEEELSPRRLSQAQMHRCQVVSWWSANEDHRGSTVAYLLFASGLPEFYLNLFYWVWLYFRVCICSFYREKNIGMYRCMITKRGKFVLQGMYVLRVILVSHFWSQIVLKLQFRINFSFFLLGFIANIQISMVSWSLCLCATCLATPPRPKKCRSYFNVFLERGYFFLWIAL